MINARCFWFEDDGTPVEDGCPKGSHCPFVHPADYQWDRLPRQPKRPPSTLKHATWSSVRRDGDGYRDSEKDRDSRRSRSPSYRSRYPERRMREDYEKKDKGNSTSLVTSSAQPTSPTMPRKDSASVLPTPPTSSTLGASFDSNSKPPPLGPSALMRSIAASASGSEKPASANSSNSAQAGSSVAPPSLDQKTAPPVMIRLPRPTTSSTSQLPSSSMGSSRMSVDPQAAQASPPAPALLPALPPPPPPASAPPVQPPCPLPEFPKEIELTMKAATPPPELTIEEKKKIWEERIKLVADAFLAKKSLERAEQSYKYASDVTQSQLFSSLSDEEKSRQNHELQSLHAEREKSKKNYEDAMREITERGTWPIGPPPNEGEDREKMQREYGEILKYVKELKEAAMSMGKMLGDIAGMKSMPVLPVVAGAAEDANEEDDDMYATEEDRMEVDRDANDAMIVEGAGAGQLASRKRRRVADDDDQVSGGTTRAVPQPRDPDIPTREELNQLLDRLESIEAATIDLANEITQHEREVTDSFRNEAEEIVAKVETQRKVKEAKVKERERERVDGLFEKVRGENEALGRDIGVVGDEMAKLMERINQLEVDIEKEEKEKGRWSIEMKTIEDRLKGFHETRETNLRAIQTLEAALDAYKSASSQLSPPRTPSSPIASAPVHPSREYILSSLREPIIQIMREGMKPMLEQCRSETERLMEEKNKKLLEKVWPDMVLVSNVLGKMVDRLEEEGIRSAVGTGPVSVPVPSTAGGTGTGGQALSTSPVNTSAGQVQQQALKVVTAGETAQVTSPITPMAVSPPPPTQQQQRPAIYTAGSLNNLLELVLQQQQQHQTTAAGQAQTQITKTTMPAMPQLPRPPALAQSTTPMVPVVIPQQLQQQPLPRPPVPLPVAVPVHMQVTGTGSGPGQQQRQVPSPYPPPVSASPSWVSSPVQVKQEQLAHLFFPSQGGVPVQVEGQVQVQGGAPVTPQQPWMQPQQSQQQQHPPAQQQQQQQQGQVEVHRPVSGSGSGSGSTLLP